MFDFKWIEILTIKLFQTQMRACIFLEGDETWHKEFCQHYLDQDPLLKGFWVGENSPFTQAKALLPQQAAHQLGQETDFVIFSASQGIDPNSLGILSGMIKAGGLCIICLPFYQAWLKQPNIASKKYLSYPYQLQDSLKGFNHFLWQKLSLNAIHIQANQTTSELKKWLDHPELNQPTCIQILPTQDQCFAIEKINSLAFGHRKRPLLITADRGRGKSSVLGLAAVELIKQGKQKIIFTSARKNQVQIALNIIKQAGLDNAIEFRAPDELISQPKPTDILMVDEAAHLPLPLLKSILQTYHRVIFSSTQHGYEGSGRGFGLKFSSLLNSLTPGWKHIELKSPIRWQKNDWLENTINEVLLLQSVNTPRQNTSKSTNTAAEISYQQMSVKQLLQTPEKIEQLFQILVSAHYQTSPNDLMQWLDSPDLVILMAIQTNHIIGVIIATPEGNLPLTEVTTQPQRFQGHLFSQLLYKQTNNVKWMNLKGLRIMRIAVADAWQNKKTGSKLLGYLEEHAKNAQIDYLATSFGATSELINFWSQNQYQICGLGIKADKASGTHSILLALPISSNAKHLILQTQTGFKEEFSFALMSEFKFLEAETLLTIIGLLSFPKQAFPQGYLTNQPYENISFALRNWLISHPSILISLTDKTLQKLIIQKIIQNVHWSQLSYSDKQNNRKQFERHLKHFFNSKSFY